MEWHIHFAITVLERAEYCSLLHETEETTDRPFTMRSTGNIPERRRGLHKTWPSLEKSLFQAK